MPTERITRRTLGAINETGRRFYIYDTELRGFGIAVQPSGAASYFAEWRSGLGRTGSTRRIVISPVKAMPLDKAREAAGRLLAQAKLARLDAADDPADKRRAMRKAASFEDVANAFLAEHMGKKRKASTTTLYRGHLNKHVLPTLGKKRIGEITRADVMRLHGALSDRPVRANHVLRIIRSMYTWAGKAGYVPESFNPASRIEENPEKPRERFLNSGEWERLGTALREAETIGLPWSVDDSKPGAKHLAFPENRRTLYSKHAVVAIRLLMLTGCRLREILHLRWLDVDFQRGMLHLADSKTGKKSIVLNTPALTLLKDLEQVGDYVIAGDDPKRPRADLKKPWHAICRRAGFVELVDKIGADGKPVKTVEGNPIIVERNTLRMHDLRHSFASVGAGERMGLPILGKLLGHSLAATTQRYAHLDSDQLRNASNHIGATIMEAMDGT